MVVAKKIMKTKKLKFTGDFSELGDLGYKFHGTLKFWQKDFARGWEIANVSINAATRNVEISDFYYCSHVLAEYIRDHAAERIDNVFPGFVGLHIVLNKDTLEIEVYDRIKHCAILYVVRDDKDSYAAWKLFSEEFKQALIPNISSQEFCALYRDIIIPAKIVNEIRDMFQRGLLEIVEAEV